MKNIYCNFLTSYKILLNMSIKYNIIYYYAYYKIVFNIFKIIKLLSSV